MCRVISRVRCSERGGRRGGHNAAIEHAFTVKYGFGRGKQRRGHLEVMVRF
jgi:hypothetical protein